VRESPDGCVCVADVAVLTAFVPPLADPALWMELCSNVKDVKEGYGDTPSTGPPTGK
jgi:hypothetical protein